MNHEPPKKKKWWFVTKMGQKENFHAATECITAALKALSCSDSLLYPQFYSRISDSIILQTEAGFRTMKTGSITLLDSRSTRKGWGLLTVSSIAVGVGPASVMVGNLVAGKRIAQAAGRDLGLIEDQDLVRKVVYPVSNSRTGN